MKIKDLNKTERPREKIERYGVQKLADYELVALLLGSGIRGANVLNLSKKVLELLDRDSRGNITLEDLTKIRGLGKAKATQILAALEWGNRRNNEVREIVIMPEKVFELCADIRDSRKENFVVFYLNTRNALISREIISVGTLNESLVHPREIFEPAIKHGAAKILLAHNHPSGDVDPSEDDKEVTARVMEAGRLLGIELVDHIILTKGRFLSFSVHGLLS